MRKSSRLALGALATTLFIVAMPASALSTAGWNQADRSAATIREFQTRLMVAALRCRAAGINVLASYNQFIAADRAELTAANDRLKAHFASINSVSGDRDYDRYTTSLANSFAGEQWSPASCDRADRQARNAAQSRGNLLTVASSDAPTADALPAYAYAPQANSDREGSPGYGSAPSRYGEDWQGPQAYDDRGPPPGYDDQGSPPRYRDDSPSEQAYDDRGPPPGYDDHAPSWRDRGDSRSQQAYNEPSPPSAYDDRGYDDRPSFGGYYGY